MPLDRLINLLAEAAAKRISQEREAKTATPNGVLTAYLRRIARASTLSVRGKQIANLCRLSR